MKTTEIPTGGNGGNFTNYKLQPETQVVYIESFNLRFATHSSATAGEVTLSMECRGPSIEGFEGFQVDKNDPSKGKRNHQVGYIKASNFNFADKRIGERDVERDVEIGRFMVEVMTALGCKEWLDSIDPEGIMNLELWFTKVNAPDAPWRNKPLRLCVACRQYWRPQDKYAQNDLFVVKWKKDQVRMEDGNIPLEESKVVKWDPNNLEHMERAVKPALVAGFQGKAEAPTSTTAVFDPKKEEEEDTSDIPF